MVKQTLVFDGGGRGGGIAQTFNKQSNKKQKHKNNKKKEGSIHVMPQREGCSTRI